jgi:phthalate 4,5-dioxygenase
MLSKEDNELITHTGPGTPMGELMRRFWFPAMLSTELPEPDAAPLRVRLLSEDLVAFRDTNGEVGLLAANCPHRGASLFFGRNEECGIRCVYHGWKFDVTGQCVDMPSEPAESNFKSKIRATAYPTRERAGVIWTYMGPPELMAEPPELEWARVPESQVVVSKYIASCNYLQTMEGNLDSSHISFLHSRLPGQEAPTRGGGPTFPGQKYNRRDGSPRFSVKDTEYGMMVAARRNAEEDSYYWRISQWMFPFFDMIGHDPGAMAMSAHAQVPMDDEHTLVFAVRWEGDHAMTPKERTMWGGENARVRVKPGGYWPRANRENDYLLDREAQRTRSFTGIDGIGEQDLAVTESMGAIFDRTKEHLGTSDLAIIGARRRLLQAARDLQRGIEPYAAQHPELYHIRPTSAVLPREIYFDQDEQVRQSMMAHT